MSAAAEEIPSEPWTPSPQLHVRLGTAIWATLVAGSLAASSSLVALTQAPQPGFTLVHSLGWAALVPLWWVVGAYRALGRETGSPGLGKSAVCLFAAAVVLKVYELATLNLFLLGGQIVLWVLFGLGLLGLVFLPFVSGSESNLSSPPSPAPTGEAAAAGKAKAGLIGGLVIALLAGLKIFGKVILKLFALRAVARLLPLFGLDWGSVGAVVTWLLAGGFLIWFAVSKIRLRQRLGGLAALLGWVEILGLLFFVGMAVWSGVQFAEAAQQHLNDQPPAEVQQKILADLTLCELVADMLWATLTVCLFVSLRHHVDPDMDFQQEWATPETDQG